MPPELAHEPMEITHLGSAICSYTRSTMGATFLKTVPEMIRRSDCLGDPLRTSAPKRARSKREVNAAASSTKQQDRPKNMGQRLYRLDQLIRKSVVLRRKPCVSPMTPE